MATKVRRPPPLNNLDRLLLAASGAWFNRAGMTANWEMISDGNIFEWVYGYPSVFNSGVNIRS